VYNIGLAGVSELITPADGVQTVNSTALPSQHSIITWLPVHVTLTWVALTWIALRALSLTVVLSARLPVMQQVTIAHRDERLYCLPPALRSFALYIAQYL